MRTTQVKEHYEYRESHKTDFLKEQVECPICYGKLDIIVECINPHQIKEEARCVECMALSRVEDHLLH